MNMKVPPKKTTTQNANSAQSVDLEGQIRRRAYELYELRGRGDGRDREDWIQAEAELASERQNLLPGETELIPILLRRIAEHTVGPCT